jgi:hypothetical protein
MHTETKQKLNKMEEIKALKDPFDISDEIPRFASEGWENIPDDDKERLKWRGRSGPALSAPGIWCAHRHYPR